MPQPQGLSAFDGIRWSQYDEEQDILLAWYGGHGIHGYNLAGEEVCFWNTGNFEYDEPSINHVKQNMREHIEHQDYLELY